MDLARERDDAYEKLYVELPEGFTTITANMFGDIQIKELYIPASVTKIEEGAFGAQIYITNIRVSSINPKYRSQNGVLYNKKMTTLICYPMSKKGSTFVVPDTVRKTAPLSFRGNYYLEKVVLPKNLRKLGRGSFLKSAISEWRCDGGVKKYEKSAFNYIAAADGYAIDMNTLTKLYQELLYTNATTDVSYWVKTIWNWLTM